MKKVDFKELKPGDRVFVKPRFYFRYGVSRLDGFIGYVYETPTKSYDSFVVYIDTRDDERRKEIPNMWTDTPIPMEQRCEIRYDDDEYFITDLPTQDACDEYQKLMNDENKMYP